MTLDLLTMKAFDELVDIKQTYIHFHTFLRTLTGSTAIKRAALETVFVAASESQT